MRMFGFYVQDHEDESLQFWVEAVNSERARKKVEKLLEAVRHEYVVEDGSSLESNKKTWRIEPDIDATWKK